MGSDSLVVDSSASWKHGLRWLLGAAFLLTAVGCSAAGASAAEVGEEVSVDDAIVEVDHTPVERQSIGNCWIYAEATWIESMHKTATGADLDISQSWMTYWHWYDQVMAGAKSVETGGFWSTANSLVERYGIVEEKDFVEQDTQAEMSLRQSAALASLNEALKTANLTTGRGLRRRIDGAKVRAILDEAWQIKPPVREYMTRVFGESFNRSLTRSATNAGTPVKRASEIPAAYSTGPGRPVVTKTVGDAIREWRSVSYSWQRDRRAYHQRVQRALHDRAPVIVTWFVDFNGLENRDNERRGSFNLTTLNDMGAGRQGWHMTVMHDYQAKLADGTVLLAGPEHVLDPQKPEDAAKLAAALEPSTEIQFYRTKNSWGASRADRSFVPGMPGYHDLYLDYLNGPVKECEVDDAGNTDTTQCNRSITPLSEVILPPGY